MCGSTIQVQQYKYSTVVVQSVLYKYSTMVVLIKFSTIPVLYQE